MRWQPYRPSRLGGEAEGVSKSSTSFRPGDSNWSNSWPTSLSFNTFAVAGKNANSSYQCFCSKWPRSFFSVSCSSLHTKVFLNEEEMTHPKYLRLKHQFITSFTCLNWRSVWLPCCSWFLSVIVFFNVSLCCWKLFPVMEHKHKSVNIC